MFVIISVFTSEEVQDSKIKLGMVGMFPYNDSVKMSYILGCQLINYKNIPYNMEVYDKQYLEK